MIRKFTRSLVFFSLVLITLTFAQLTVVAQSPQTMSYQAVIRNSSNQLVTNHEVGMRVSILQGSATGTPVYIETLSQTTNANGLLSIEIGSEPGFKSINWAKGPYFIKTETDPTGGFDYTITSTSQLLSVPFALMSNTAARSLNDLDTNPTNELQILKLRNDTLFLDRGGFVLLGVNTGSIEIQKIKKKLIADSLYFEVKMRDENLNRQNNDSILAQKINSDSNYLNGLINTNTTNISDEINTRIANDNGIRDKVISDSAYLKGLINNTNMGSEIINRTYADSILQTNLTNEINARILGDSKLITKGFSDSLYLKGLIISETNTRISSDNSIINKMSSDSSSLRTIINTTKTNLANETNSRISGDNNLNTKVVSDSSFLKGLINTSSTNLTNETNYRISGDNNLKAKVVSDSSYLKGLINTGATNLSNETNYRITADNNLKSKEVSDSNYLKGLINTGAANLSNETNYRITADNNLKTKEVSDSSYLKGLINTGVTNLNNEANYRITADNNLKTKEVSDSNYLKGLINTGSSNLANETNSRISADNNLKSKVISDSSYLKGLINTGATNLTDETNTRISDYNNLKSKIVSDSTYMKGLINTGSSNLTNETNSRISGDNNLKAKEVSDSNYLKGLINTSMTNLTNETNSRIATDQNLKTKVLSDSIYLKGLINTSSTNLTNETNSRIAGDTYLKTKAVTDSNYLKGLINSGATNLTNETNSRISGDNNLKAKAVTDSSYFKGLLNSDATNLTNETNSRISGDNNLKAKAVTDSSYFKGLLNSGATNLASETISRISADNNLKTKSISDSSYFKGLLNSSATNLTNETNSRITGDNNLKAKVVSDSSYLKGLINIKQATLTAGSGITINSSNVIRAIDTSITNELQTISRRNDTIFLSNGGFVKFPAAFDGQYNSLTGKPSFATVATSGSYTDLTNKPTLNNGTVTNVTGTAPISVATGTSTPAISIATNTQASAGVVPAGGSNLNMVWKTNGSGVPSWSTDANSGGTVTSVGLSLPSIISVTGSPVTTSGTLTGTLVSQAARTVLAAPTAAAGTPSFRVLVAADLPGAFAGFANPTVTIGLSAVNGAATTALRSDAAPALSQAIVPTWTGTHTFSNGTYSALFTGGNVGIGIVAPTAMLHTVASGAKTTSYTGNILSNTATSSTVLIDKIGLDIKSTGTWNGTGSNNIGLLVSSVSGGTNNYDAIFSGSGVVGIGTTTPNATAALDITSTTKGFLPPRMTETEMLAIVTPVEGLMVYNTSAKLPLYYNGTYWCKIDGNNLYIGKSYQGGIIAYILQSGDPGYVAGETHGIIAAPFDQSSASSWGCKGTTITGADGIVIGSGYQNTLDIKNGCPTAAIASKICEDLVLNGNNDWYLPSKDELSKLYTNQTAIGGFTNFNYWSSTEYDANNAWRQNFQTGNQLYYGKDYTLYVRAIRAF